MNVKEEYAGALPVAKPCKRLLGYAGLEVVEGEDARADVEINVRVSVAALTTMNIDDLLTRPNHYWMGARASGWVRVLADGSPLGAFSFRGVVHPREVFRFSTGGPVVVGGLSLLRSAPFQEAFELPFAKAWWLGTAQVWGARQ